MNKKLAFGFIIFLLLLAGCGPSPEQAATMTASAWTPTPAPTSTPLPTATATPIPYDLTIKVTDADGVPVAGASLSLEGGAESVIADENGMAEWTNLAGPDGSIDVAAQGFFASNQSFDLSRGPNELVVALERDPFGLLPSLACATTETLLYIEDFQDSEAQGWPEIDLHANGWNIAEYADEPGNLVASNNLFEHFGSNLQNMTFTDAVWRVRFFVKGRRAISMNWLQSYGYELDGQHIDDSRYQVVIDTNGTDIRRLTLPVLNISASRGKGAPASAWHNLEISTFQGDTQIWLNGTRLAGYIDPKPLPGGGIGIELFNFDSSLPDTVIYFDNISVCSLTAPFSTLYPVP